MNRNLTRLLVLLPWLSVPFALAAFFTLRGRLPERLAVHFSGDAPDGWMSRWQFAAFIVAALLVVLANYTWKLTRGAEPEKFVLLLLYLYAGTAIVLGVSAFVVLHNL